MFSVGTFDFFQLLLQLVLLVLQGFQLAQGLFLLVGGLLLPPRQQLHVDAEEAAAVELLVALLIAVNVAVALLGEEVVEGDEDARVGGAHQVVVGAGAEGAHGGRKVHIGIDERRHRAAALAHRMEQYLVVFLVVAAGEELHQLVVVALDADPLVGPHQAVAVGEMLLVEVEDEVARLAVQVAVHRYLAEEVARLGYLQYQAPQAVPQVVEAVEALAEVVAGLVGGLNKSAAKLHGVRQILVDEQLAELVLVRRGRNDGAVLAAHHVAAVDEAVGADNFLVLGAPHKELLAAVGVVEGVVHVDVHLLARAAAVGGEAQLAQTPDLAHDVGREVGRGDIYLLVAVVALAQKMLLLQLFLYQLPVNGRCYV